MEADRKELTITCYHRPVSARSWKLLAALLLTIAIGPQLLELTGRWDRTFQDANDEAGIVAVVFCVGIAIAIARTLPARLQASRRLSLIPRATVHIDAAGAAAPLVAVLRGSPPTTLRI